MNKIRPQITIVEGEFLIALDAEYLIKSSLECQVSLVRIEQLDALEDRELKAIDLCLLDVPLDPSDALARARRLQDCGVRMLFTTVSEFHRHGVAGHEETPVVMKPFEGEKLVAAVRALLRPDHGAQT